MQQPLLLGLAVLAGAAVAAACGQTDTGLSGTYNGYGDGGDGINMTGVGAGTGAATGLPCDVQQLLENRCIGCHAGTSPPPLLSYANLVAPSSDPSKTEAQKSLERMQSATSPMPPVPAIAPTPAEIATLSTWVTAGTPMGTACTTGADAGAPMSYNTPTVCTSGTMYKGGESSTMSPGGACLTCHSRQGGPSFTIGGTVYATAHEPNDCNGVNGKLTVVVTDKNGTVTNLAVNSVGNFSSRTAVVPPFNVKVTDGAKTRAMVGTLTAGDCNTCHTVNGANGAPGRIMAP